MSLTSDIAALVAAANTLIATYDAKKAGIDASVAAAIAALPDMSRNYFVDQLNGNDANAGTAVASPLQSIERAIALAGAGRMINISLLGNYTLTAPRIVLRVGQHLRISSYGAVLGDIKYKIFLGLHAVAYTDITGNWEVGGFYSSTYGTCTVSFTSVEIVFPAAPGAGTLVPDVYNGLVAGNANDGPALNGLEINYCTLTRPAGTVGVVLGTRTHFGGLFVKNTIYVSGDLAGKWIAGVAAGSTPASVGWVASNLSTL